MDATQDTDQSTMWAPLPQPEADEAPKKTRKKPRPNIKKLLPSFPKKDQRHSGKGTTGVDNAVANRKRPKSVIEVLGYQALLPSGVAWLGADEWSLTLHISDINYVAAGQDRQEDLLDQWAKFLNSYGAGTRIQETVLNRVLDDRDVAQMLQKQYQNDGLDRWREDFNGIVRGTLSKNSGNTVTEKFITITVQEPDQDKAESALLRIGNEATATLRSLDDCRASVLDREARMRVISNITRPREPFFFDEEAFAPQKRLRTHDYVAPWSIDSTTKSGPLVLTSNANATYHQTIWVRDYPAWLSDRIVADLTEIKADIVTSLHLEPYEQVDGAAVVQRQIAELEMQIIDEQKKADKRGYDREMIPQRLKDADAEAKAMRDELKASNQKVFSTLFTVGVSAPTRERLDEVVKTALTVVRKHSCQAELTSYMQRDALTSELPLGIRALPMRRTLTTASAAIIVPFTTQELFQVGGNYAGLNQQSGNAVVVDRTQNSNQNGFILGESGSGKGVAGKHDIMNVLTNRPNDEVIIIDPEHEYEPLVDAFDGSVVRIHAGSPDRINPLDINLDDESNGDPIATKSESLLNMLGTLIGGRHGLTDPQRSIVDRCAVEMYREYSVAPENTPQPTLVDLRQKLLDTNDADATAVAASLEIYTVGSLNTFSQQTTVDDRKRLISYDISQLGPELRTFGMMVILEQLWRRVVTNRYTKKRTWVYIDEFHLLFSNPYSSEYFKTFYKRARKYGAAPTGITQDIEELLESPDARLMLANSKYLYLLGQSKTNADILEELLGLSSDQTKYMHNVAPGTGLIRSGNAIVPVDGKMPTDSDLFALYDTKFEE